MYCATAASSASILQPPRYDDLQAGLADRLSNDTVPEDLTPAESMRLIVKVLRPILDTKYK